MGNKRRDLFFSLKKRRGLSSIVTRLIIILLVIVLIGVIWVVVEGVLQSTSTSINLQQYTLNLKIESAKLSSNNSSIAVTVGREAGAGNFSAIDFIFSNGNESKTIRRNGSIQELGNKNYNFLLSEIGLNNLDEVSIAPVLTSYGRTAVGNILYTISLPAIINLGTGAAVATSNFEKYGLVGVGKEDYRIESTSNSVVKLDNVVINPVDVHVGDNQTLSVDVYSPNNITSVTAKTQLDSGTLILNLSQTGEDSFGKTYGTTWIVNDTHATTYRTTFTAIDSKGNEGSVELTWTDPCLGITQGANSILQTNCIISSPVYGLDGGNLSFNNKPNLTLDGTFVWNQGYSISLTGIGSIAFGSGGSLQKGYLYEYDPSGAGYGNGTFTWGASATAPSKEIRAKDSLGTDCNPGSKYVYRNVSTGIDNDHDGYTVSAASTHCVGNSTTISGRTYYMDNSGNYSFIASGSMLGTGDCYDYNANVHPGQTAWFTTPYIGLSGSSYDYNCDGTATEEYTTTGASCTICHVGPSSCLQTLGTLGWTGTTVPACGSTGTYVSQIGSCPTSTSGGCPVNSCTSGTTTQACH